MLAPVHVLHIERIGMKRFAVLLFWLLAESSFAGDCSHISDANQLVDITWLSKVYRQAVRSLPVPTIERGDNVTKFREGFLDVVVNYKNELLTIIVARAEEIGEELINAVRKLESNLRRCIRSKETGGKDAACADRILKLLTTQYEEFFSLIPGRALIKRQALPELPEQTVEVVSRTKELEPAEVFVDLARKIDDDFRSFYAFVNSMLIAGWDAVRLELNNFQTQIRDKILNDKVLKVYREIADAIVNSGTQRHVDPETWGPFQDIVDRIRAISDDYNAYALENREWS